MHYYKLIAIAACAIVTATATGQQSMVKTDAVAEFNEALSLVEAGMYGAARTKMDNYINKHNGDDIALTADARYYRGYAAKMDDNDDAPALMLDFLETCPHSQRRSDMLYQMGDFYLLRSKFTEALKWFEKVSERRISEEFHSPYLFKTGYCYFMRGQHKKAISYFDRLHDDGGEYASAVTYYRAHVEYENGNYNEALKGMLALVDDEGFGNVAPYYVADIMYRQQHYAEAIRYAQPLAQSGSKKGSDMMRIVADSHFALGEYAEARTAYQKLVSSTKRLTRNDYYNIGLTNFYLEDYTAAAQNLSKVTSNDDIMSQNAYYHLGYCYLKQDDKRRARTAMEAAARYDYDRAVKEDAEFNRLKLSYELNYSSFKDLVGEFVNFINTYPQSDKIDEAYDYMSHALLTTKNYKEALQTMEKMPHKNLKIYTAMQRIAFYRGLELYDNSKYTQAIEFFDYSLKYADYDPTIRARTYYWKAESLYRLNRIDEANALYYSFIQTYGASELTEFTTAHYNLGYTFFNNKKYAESRRWFLKYVNLKVLPENRLLADAYNRLGDCYYVERDFQFAVEYYDKAYQTYTPSGDYSLLQKGICLGLTQDNNAKIAQLKEMIAKYPNSELCAYAYYETARANIAINDITGAIYNYKVVKERYPKSSLASKAMLQLGLLYYNNSEYENSMAFYKRVINEYPSTQQASEALVGLRNVYMELGDYDGYIAYTNTLGSFAKVETAEKDSLLFVSAEKRFATGDMKAAEEAFNRYISECPSGRYITGAHYYLANCYYSTGNDAEALKAYTYVASQPRSVFTEEALLHTGELLYKSKDYNSALNMFGRLENEAEVAANKTEAIIGQMRCMEKLGDTEGCISSADKVIKMPQASPEILREANFLKMKSLIAAGRAGEAISTMKELAQSTKTEEGAEAKYLLAQYYFDSQALDTAEKEVFDYIDKGTPHQYWLARTFVLLSDIYHKRGDDFQACQYLISLQESYNENEEINKMIKTRLDAWGAETGSSALPD